MVKCHYCNYFYEQHFLVHIMRYSYIVLLIFLLLNCKNDNPERGFNQIKDQEEIQLSIDSVPMPKGAMELNEKSVSIEMKQKDLIQKKDQRLAYEPLLIEKTYIEVRKDYTINFKYPLLNESLKPTHANFNQFITNHYVNINKAIADIDASKLLCDSIASLKFREDRFIDYKIYIVNDQLVSVLFYKENFQSGAMHPSYSFDCFNFDLNKGLFMSFEDFFNQGSEEEVLHILNQKIISNIQNANLYYDCWEVSSSDFFASKNNFVVNDDVVEFYFDDCVMCPSYTGSYSIALPLEELLPVLKKSNAVPLNLNAKGGK